MSEPTLPDQNHVDGRRLQDTFELYVLGLTFTILGLSVQTATFGIGVIADIIELIAWVMLFISGMAGLYRGQWKPNLYHVFGMKATREVETEDVEKVIDNLQNKITRSGHVQKWFFVLGLLALIMARGYHPVAGVIKAIRC